MKEISEEYTFLHSGRPLPTSEDVHATWNEGARIPLNEKATIAWRAAREKWRAVSSRIVTARLKFVAKGQRRPGGFRQTSNTFMTILSMHASTAKPFHLLNRTSTKTYRTPSILFLSDILVLLGDFSARVKKKDCSQQQHWGTIAWMKRMKLETNS